MTNYQSMFFFCKMWWRLWQRYCEGPHNDEPLKIDGGSEHLPKRRQLQGNISIFSRTRCYSIPRSKCIKVFTGEPQAVRAAGARPWSDLRTNESERCQPCSVRQPGASCSICRNQVALEWKRSCIFRHLEGGSMTWWQQLIASTSIHTRDTWDRLLQTL